MGIDAVIEFECDGDPDISLLEASYKEADEYAWSREATHCVTDGIGRYFSEDYPRGNWPKLAAILMQLLAHPNVKRVWYCGDSFEAQICTPETVLRISAFYMGDRS